MKWVRWHVDERHGRKRVWHQVGAVQRSLGGPITRCGRDYYDREGVEYGEEKLADPNAPICGNCLKLGLKDRRARDDAAKALAADNASAG